MDTGLSKALNLAATPYSPETLASAYDACLALAQSHYENFPVASILLPKNVRPAVAVIYTFARRADDYADEGDLPTTKRLAQLAKFRAEIDGLSQGKASTEPLFIALADVVAHYHLPLQLFRDLLTAFEQDVTKKRYADSADVLTYCAHSANPVGRLMLHLFNQTSPRNLADSDAICSALQLINFLQDMAQDYHEMDRIYLPLDLLQASSVSEHHFRDRITDTAMRNAYSTAVKQARALMLQGAPLAWNVSGRFGWELRAIVSGGLSILDQCEKQHDDVFSRPRRRWRDWLKIVTTLLRSNPPIA